MLTLFATLVFYFNGKKKENEEGEVDVLALVVPFFAWIFILSSRISKVILAQCRNVSPICKCRPRNASYSEAR